MPEFLYGIAPKVTVPRPPKNEAVPAMVKLPFVNWHICKPLDWTSQPLELTIKPGFPIFVLQDNVIDLQ
jgi:hypothetical protein